jgi:hypothetical protein
MKLFPPRGWVIALAAIVLTLTAQPAKAGFIVQGPGESGLGSFTGTLNVATVNTNAATLTFSLTNTSPVANGGLLTAFVFNNPDSSLYSVTFGSSTKATFATFDDDEDGVGGSPFGQFDYLMSVGDGFQGSGPPSDGLAVGESATWVFNVTGIGAGALTDDDFLDALSVPPGIGGGAQAFVVRFRGFANEGSDKVPGGGGGAGGHANTVPAPAGLILLASAFPVLAFRRLIRRKPVAA